MIIFKKTVIEFEKRGDMTRILSICVISLMFQAFGAFYPLTAWNSNYNSWPKLPSTKQNWNEGAEGKVYSSKAYQSRTDEFHKSAFAEANRRLFSKTTWLLHGWFIIQGRGRFLVARRLSSREELEALESQQACTFFCSLKVQFPHLLWPRWSCSLHVPSLERREAYFPKHAEMPPQGPVPIPPKAMLREKWFLLFALLCGFPSIINGKRLPPSLSRDENSFCCRNWKASREEEKFLLNSIPIWHSKSITRQKPFPHHLFNWIECSEEEPARECVDQTRQLGWDSIEWKMKIIY